jgi:hypothetical protein
MRGGEWFKLWRRRNDGFDDADNRRSTGRHGGGPVRRTGGWWRTGTKKEEASAQSGKPAIDPASPMAHGLF